MLPSLQGEPLAFTGDEHIPVAGSQVPASWQASRGAHVVALPAVQVPPWQVSACVQPLPSLQAAPLERVPQMPSTVAPAVTLQAWQSFATLPPQALLQHTPSTQKSDAHSVPTVHAVPSRLVGPPKNSEACPSRSSG